MNARELEAVSQDLSRSHRRESEALLVAGGCAVVALGAAALAAPLAIALGAGAVAGALFAVLSRLARRDRIARLALDPDAYELAEVSRYANRLTSRLERERLSGWLLEIVAEAHVPGNWYLADRVTRYAEELAALSRDLADPRARIGGASAAACHLLLTRAVDSPLYNPAVPAELLPTIIARIRLGISIGSA